jgi:hypothetical protein
LVNPSGLYYPNRIARLFVDSIEEVMGQSSLNAILSLAGLDEYIRYPIEDDLRKAFDFSGMAGICQALEDLYGVRGGRGMSLRIGRAAFARGIKNFGAMAGMRHPAFIALPLEQRISLGLDALAAIFTNFSDQDSIVIDDGDCYIFETPHSPFAWGRTADRPICHALVGIIQESLRWATDGYEFHVQEIECRAAGGTSCIFQINKQPIGHS